MTGSGSDERVINVADIDPQHRHAIMFRLFEHLVDRGDSVPDACGGAPLVLDVGCANGVPGVGELNK